MSMSTFSPATEEILKRVSPNNSATNTHPPNNYVTAREAVVNNMTTSDSIVPTTSQPHISTTVTRDEAMDIEAAAAVQEAQKEAMEADAPTTTGRGRGRGRGAGRPRASGRAGRPHTTTTTREPETSTTPRGPGGRPRGGRGSNRGRRGGKRGGRKNLDAEDIIKAEDSDDDDDDDDDDNNDNDNHDQDSDKPTATRSGRAIQKPTTFIPPVAGQKRKRRGGGGNLGGRHRNPESTVCSSCHRPHSPTTNMIVFCDGCNTPFHRHCHHPPIPQSVVDNPAEEWNCSTCCSDAADNTAPNGGGMLLPLPLALQDPDVDTFVAVPTGKLTSVQKREVLSLLPVKTLVTLLLRANSLRPDLPIYPPGVTKMPLPTTLAALVEQDPNRRAVNGHVFPSSPSDGDDDDGGDEKEGRIPDHAIRPPDPDPEEDDPAMGYPRPGFGLARTMPPEEDDLKWLIDGNEEVYSHLYRVDHEGARRGLSGGKEKGKKGEEGLVDKDLNSNGGETEATAGIEGKGKGVAS